LSHEHVSGFIFQSYARTNFSSFNTLYQFPHKKIVFKSKGRVKKFSKFHQQSAKDTWASKSSSLLVRSPADVYEKIFVGWKNICREKSSLKWSRLVFTVMHELTAL
jgi:hypothetical protein